MKGSSPIVPKEEFDELKALVLDTINNGQPLDSLINDFIDYSIKFSLCVKKNGVSPLHYCNKESLVNDTLDKSYCFFMSIYNNLPNSLNDLEITYWAKYKSITPDEWHELKVKFYELIADFVHPPRSSPHHRIDKY